MFSPTDYVCAFAMEVDVQTALGPIIHVDLEAELALYWFSFQDQE